MTTPHIVAILDRSGSMHTIRADTIGGFNTFLRDQQAIPGGADLTLVITDGFENASQEFTREQIAKLIKQCEGNGWRFGQSMTTQDWAELDQKLADVPKADAPST